MFSQAQTSNTPFRCWRVFVSAAIAGSRRFSIRRGFGKVCDSSVCIGTGGGAEEQVPHRRAGFSPHLIPGSCLMGGILNISRGPFPLRQLRFGRPGLFTIENHQTDHEGPGRACARWTRAPRLIPAQRREGGVNTPPYRCTGDARASPHTPSEGWVGFSIVVCRPWLPAVPPPPPPPAPPEWPGP